MIKSKDLSEIKSFPLKHYVSAISVGLHEQNNVVTPILDLNYEEDSEIGTDMNFVMTDKNDFIEIQGTAEEGTFTKQQLLEMMSLAEIGCKNLFLEQEKVIGAFFPLKR